MSHSFHISRGFQHIDLKNYSVFPPVYPSCVQASKPVLHSQLSVCTKRNDNVRRRNVSKVTMKFISQTDIHKNTPPKGVFLKTNIICFEKNNRCNTLGDRHEAETEPCKLSRKMHTQHRTSLFGASHCFYGRFDRPCSAVVRL